MDKLIINSPIIITLDIDDLLFDKLQQINEIGLNYVEINTSEQTILKSVIESFPKLTIGAGNIINTSQLESSYEAHVKFVTSPGLLPEIAQTANIYSIKYLPGVSTLSEAMEAMNLGCYQVRPFPADLTMCTLLNKYLPKLNLFPAEIELEEIEHFLSLPSVTAVSIINPELKQLHALRSFVLTEVP